MQMSKLASTMIGAENLEKYKHCMSNQDQVFTYLESTGASYVALYQQKGDCEPEQPHKRNVRLTMVVLHLQQLLTN
jgi:hypothetical protein